MGALLGCLCVDERSRRQQQLDLGPPAEAVGAEALTQLGQQHAQRTPGLGGDVLAPAGDQQVLAGHRPAAVEREIGEQDSPSAAGQPVFDADPSMTTTYRPQSWILVAPSSLIR